MQFAQNLITRNISKHLSAELVQLLINRVEEWGDKGVSLQKIKMWEFKNTGNVSMDGWRHYHELILHQSMTYQHCRLLMRNL